MPEDRTPAASSRRDSVGNTLLVAVVLSLVCSLLVASTAVLLKPKQQENEERFRQATILEVAGLLETDADVASLFAGIEARLVRLADGSYEDSIAAPEFDALAAADDPEYGVPIPASLDLANIGRRASHAPVYLVRSGGEIEQVILPIYGAGLWSAIYGYIAVAADGNTVRAIRFHEHAETPGLGDQIDSPAWRAKWAGKKLYGQDESPRIEVIRSFVPAGAAAPHHIDGISGATLTGRGVTNLVRYWTGPHGFGPYLHKLGSEYVGRE